MFSFLFDKYQGVGLLNYMANLYGKFRMANLYGKFRRYYHTVLQFTFPPAKYNGSSCSTSSPKFGIVSLFNFCHSSGFNMHLTAVLICISLTNSDGENIFMYLLVIYESSFQTCLFKSYAQILIGLSVILLCCKSSLYVLNASPLSDLCFTNIFSQFITCLFPLGIPWKIQKVLNFDKVHFTTFFFCSSCFLCPA